ncbi:MAG: hypothetical protein ABUU24_01235 [Variovorax sp.]
MKSIRWALLALVLGGCVSQPVIDPKNFAPPKSAVIIDVPKIHPAATVGVNVPWAPGANWFHFSQRADYYFLAGSPQGPVRVDHQTAIAAQTQQQMDQRMLASPTPMPMGQIAGAALAGAAIGAIIQSSADDTFRKSQQFHAEILKLYPNYDLRTDFMNALVAAVKSHGVAVTLALDGGSAAPRLRWPAVDEQKNVLSTASADSFAAVDADILVQVSPVAFYNSPGPLNSYTRNVSVGIAMYNGRTKQFIGRQNVWYAGPSGRFSYSLYDSLVADLKDAAPALREALLSLVPDVADIVAGKPVVRR